MRKFFNFQTNFFVASTTSELNGLMDYKILTFPFNSHSINLSSTQASARQVSKSGEEVIKSNESA